LIFPGFYCSSCYAYAAQGAIEGAIFKKYGRLQKLSDQVVIDCNKNQQTGNWGCNVNTFYKHFLRII
jgi:Papain family cysteine protease